VATSRTALSTVLKLYLFTSSRRTHCPTTIRHALMGLLLRCRPSYGYLSEFQSVEAAQAPQLPKLPQCMSELEQRLSPACWSSSSRRLDYSRISAARSMSFTSLIQHARTSCHRSDFDVRWRSCRRGCTSCAAVPLCIAMDAFLRGIGHD